MRVLFIFVSMSLRVLAAPCCGASTTASPLIIGSDAHQLSSSYSYGWIHSEAAQNGEIRQRGATESDVSQRLTLSGAVLLGKSTQSGFAIPMVHRWRSRADSNVSSFGLGDVSGRVGWKFLPVSAAGLEGLLYLSLTAPTGTSEYESASLLRGDVRGRGFWSAGLGMHYAKSFRRWELALAGEIHRSFNRTFLLQSSAGEYALSPGVGGETTMSLGVRPINSLKVGASIGRSFEESVTASGAINSVYASSAYWTAGASINYYLPEGWTVGVTYTDQTLLPARNVALTKSTILVLQKNLPR